MLMMAKGKFHPWLALTLAILAGAALFVLLLEQPGREAASPPSASTELPEPATAAGSKLAGAAPVILHQTEISPELLEQFRRHLRSSMLRRYGLDWMDASSGKELFLAGHTREAWRRPNGSSRDELRLAIEMRRRGCSVCGFGATTRNSSIHSETSRSAHRRIDNGFRPLRIDYRPPHAPRHWRPSMWRQNRARSRHRSARDLRPST